MKILRLFAVVFLFSACRQEIPILPKSNSRASIDTSAVKSDIMPDKAAFKIKLIKDNASCDETMVIFNHLSGTKYSIDEDARYLQGFGQASLATISSDGIDLAINGLPYTPGITVGLDIHTKTDGTFLLAMSYENKIPENIQVWLEDGYLKDSVNVRKGSYSFKMSKADTGSFGNKRFKLILKE